MSSLLRPPDDWITTVKEEMRYLYVHFDFYRYQFKQSRNAGKKNKKQLSETRLSKGQVITATCININLPI